jgi:hypothetical protein
MELDAKFYVQGQPSPLSFSRSGLPEEVVEFETAGLSVPITITIVFSGQEESISAFPCSLEWLVKAQNITCPFGWGVWSDLSSCKRRVSQRGNRKVKRLKIRE